MSGILDNKTRVIDTVITNEGRRQLVNGGIDIKYVSFTDSSTFYRPDVVSGSQDATKRIYLEASQMPHDDITFRADDRGNIEPFRNSDGIPVAAGRILQYSFDALTSSVLSGSSQTVTQLSGDEFLTSAGRLLMSAIDNFQKQYLISTRDVVFEDDGFAVGPERVTFTINNDRPISDPNLHAVDINSLDSIFSDPRFSNHVNFRFLPPTNKINDETVDRSSPESTNTYALGQYKPWGKTHTSGLTYEQVAEELKYYKMLGYEQEFRFEPTSRENRLVGQFFEIGFDSMKKLDVIEYGIHKTGNANTPTAHVFFVGKIEVDEKGTDTFIHLFTLVFE